MIETAETPFDLTQGPVIRIYLIWRDMSSPDEDEEKIEQYLHLTVHHIAVDLWSLVVMIDELSILYKAAKGKSRFKRKKVHVSCSSEFTSIREIRCIARSTREIIKISGTDGKVLAPALCRFYSGAFDTH